MREIRIPFTHGAPAARARRAVEAALRAWGLVASTDDVLLITTELIQNVEVHTDDGGEFHLELHSDAVRVEVADSSPEMPQLRTSGPGTPGGRGLFLIAAIAQAWGVHPHNWNGHHGKLIWADVSIAA
jgi:hypothetical protein